MCNEEKIVKIFVFMGGFAAPTTLLASIEQQVLEILPALHPGTGYTLEQLCGPGFWNPLPYGQRRLAGRCMVHMIRNGMLPLDFTGHMCATPKRYQLR